MLPHKNYDSFIELDTGFELGQCGHLGAKTSFTWPLNQRPHCGEKPPSSIKFTSQLLLRL
jgi:hypothetical protein